MGKEFGGKQAGKDLMYHHHRRDSPMVTTGAGRVLEELGQPKMPWRRRRLNGEHKLTSYGGRIAVGTLGA